MADPESPQPHAPKGPIKAASLNSLISKPGRGGRRAGAGRPKGLKWKSTLEKEALRTVVLERMRAMLLPALEAYRELVDQREFPSVRYATARHVIEQELGKPGESVTVDVTLNMDGLIAKLEAWKAKNRKGQE